MANSREKLYNNVSNYLDIGDWETFNKKMDNPESRQKFYNASSQYVDLGEWEEFDRKISNIKPTAYNTGKEGVFYDFSEVKSGKGYRAGMEDPVDTPAYSSKVANLLENKFLDDRPVEEKVGYIVDQASQEIDSGKNDIEQYLVDKAMRGDVQEGINLTDVRSGNFVNLKDAGENTGAILSTINDEIGLYNKAFTQTLESILLGKSPEKSMKHLVDYFDRLKDDEDDISLQDVSANALRGISQLMVLPPEMARHAIDSPVKFFYDLLHFFAIDSPEMVRNLMTASMMNPIVQTKIAIGDPSGQKELDSARSMIAEYPIETLVSALALKNSISFKPASVKVKAELTLENAKRLLTESDWYRKRTIKEKGLVESMFQEISPEGLKTLLEKVGAGEKGAEAKLIKLFPEYKEYWNERNLQGGTVGYAGGFENWLKTRGKTSKSKPKDTKVVDKKVVESPTTTTDKVIITPKPTDKPGFIKVTGEAKDVKVSKIHEANRNNPYTDDLEIVYKEPSELIEVLTAEEIVDMTGGKYTEGYIKNSGLYEPIKKGDPDYVEGKELYRVEKSGQHEQTENGWKATLSTEGTPDAYLEDAVIEHIYKGLHKTNPQLYGKINSWIEAYEKVNAELGIDFLPTGVEFFAKAYVHNRLGYVKENTLLGEAILIPEDIIAEFDALVGANREGGVDLSVFENLEAKPTQTKISTEPLEDISKPLKTKEVVDKPVKPKPEKKGLKIGDEVAVRYRNKDYYGKIMSSPIGNEIGIRINNTKTSGRYAGQVINRPISDVSRIDRSKGLREYHDDLKQLPKAKRKKAIANAKEFDELLLENDSKILGPDFEEIASRHNDTKTGRELYIKELRDYISRYVGVDGDLSLTTVRSNNLSKLKEIIKDPSSIKRESLWEILDEINNDDFLGNVKVKSDDKTYSVKSVDKKPIYVSKVKLALDKFGKKYPQTKMKAENILPYLKRQGVSLEEIEAMGFKDWISNHPNKQSIDIADIKEFALSNEVIVADIIPARQLPSEDMEYHAMEIYRYDIDLGGESYNELFQTDRMLDNNPESAPGFITEHDAQIWREQFIADEVTNMIEELSYHADNGIEESLYYASIGDEVKIIKSGGDWEVYLGEDATSMPISEGSNLDAVLDKAYDELYDKAIDIQDETLPITRYRWENIDDPEWMEIYQENIDRSIRRNDGKYQELEYEYGSYTVKSDHPGEVTDYGELVLEVPNNPGGNFLQGHYTEYTDHALAHMRYDTRVIDGKPSLFINEIQSDWHKRGYDIGYYDVKKLMEFNKTMKSHSRKRKDLIEEMVTKYKFKDLKPNDIVDRFALYHQGKWLIDQNAPPGSHLQELSLFYLDKNSRYKIDGVRLFHIFPEMIDGSKVGFLGDAWKDFKEASLSSSGVNLSKKEIKFDDVMEVIKNHKKLEAHNIWELAEHSSESATNLHVNLGGLFGVKKPGALDATMLVPLRSTGIPKKHSTIDTKGDRTESGHWIYNSVLRPITEMQFVRNISKPGKGDVVSYDESAGKFVKDIQSLLDRKGSYNQLKEDLEFIKPEYRDLVEAYDRIRLDQVLDDLNFTMWDKSQKDLIPNVTHKNFKWVDLTLRRLFKKAVDDGHKSVTIANGKQVADIYNVRKVISAIKYEPPSMELVKGLRGGSGLNYWGVEFIDTEGKRIKWVGSKKVPKAMTLDELKEWIPKELISKMEKKEGDKLYNFSDTGTGEMTKDFTAKEYKEELKSGRWDSFNKIGEKYEISGQNLDVGGSFHKHLMDDVVRTKARRIAKGTGGVVKYIDVPKEGASVIGEGNMIQIKITPKMEKVFSDPIPTFSIKQHKFKDKSIEKRFSKAEEGLTKESLIKSVLEGIGSIGKGFSRKYPKLPKNKTFNQAYDILRKHEAIQNSADNKASRIIYSIVKDLSKEDFNLFQRKIIMDDLSKDFSREMDLPFGLTPDNFISEYNNLNNMVKDNEILLKAISKRNKYIKETLEELVENGILDESLLLEDPNYFHHQVLLYTNMRKDAPNLPHSLKKPTPGYGKRRKGTALDFNANYIEAEFAYLSRANKDIATAKAILEIDRVYNIAEKLKEKQKFNTGSAVGWKENIPETHIAWQPSKGNVFFTGNTMTDKALLELTSMLEIPGVDGKFVKEFLTESLMGEGLMVGGKKKQLIIPKELAETLDALQPDIKRNNLPGISHATKAWKQWTLMSPRKWFKYNLNNLSGDLDVLVGVQPSAMKKVPQACNILMKAYLYADDLPQSYWDALDRGVFDSGFSTNEINGINEMEKFFKFIKNKPNLLSRPWKWYWRNMRKFTNLRESVFRYASYLDFIEKLEKGKTVDQIGYGATNPKMLSGITDKKDLAGILSRDLLGDYGNISGNGQWMRDNMMPFWSFMEINGSRYARILRNLYRRKRYGVSAGIVSAKGVKMGLKAQYLFARLGMMTVLLKLANTLLHPEEEKELSVIDQTRPHVIVGRNENGEIVTARLQGAVSDLLEWVGFGEAVQMWRLIDTGKASYSDLFKAVTLAPTKKIINGLTPVAKIPYEFISKTSLFPDWTDARPTPDRLRHLSKNFSLENEYDWLTGRPNPGYGKSWKKAFISTVDPGQVAYYEIKGLRNKFEERKGIERDGYMSTPKSRIMVEYKRAVRYKNEDAQKKALERLREAFRFEPKYKSMSDVELNKIVKDYMENNIERLNPLSGMKNEWKGEFFDSLTGRELEKFDKAMKYYTTILNPGVNYEDVSIKNKINILSGKLESDNYTQKDKDEFLGLILDARHKKIITGRTYKQKYKLWNKK